MLITPSGDVLPCHAAQLIPGLRFGNVKNQALQEIWDSSDAFQKFRGEQWMPEPCRSCDRRAEDFGGCRCQGFLLAADATVTDPACSLAPAHGVVEAAVREANSDIGVAQAKTASSFVQLQRETAGLWDYRINPE